MIQETDAGAVCETEDEFLARYERARKIARHPLNEIRSCDGESLLGAPVFGTDGAPLTMANGAVVWRSRPRSGVTLSASGEKWEDTRWLARELRTIRRFPEERTAIAVTPEVRVEAIAGHTAPTARIRTLTVELFITRPIPRPLTEQEVDETVSGCSELTKAWFILLPNAGAEILTSAPVEKGPGSWLTSLLFRFRAPHDMAYGTSVDLG